MTRITYVVKISPDGDVRSLYFGSEIPRRYTIFSATQMNKNSNKNNNQTTKKKKGCSRISSAAIDTIDGWGTNQVLLLLLLDFGHPHRNQKKLCQSEPNNAKDDELV